MASVKTKSPKSTATNSKPVAKSGHHKPRSRQPVKSKSLIQCESHDECKSCLTLVPWIQVSSHMYKGDVRETMEDRLVILTFQSLGSTWYSFLVLDGHMGKDVVEYAAHHFNTVLQSKLGQLEKHNLKHIKEAVTATFVTIHEGTRHMTAGTTASLLLICQKPYLALVANVGDSSIMGSTGGKHAEFLSVDHNIDNPTERKRVSQIPGYSFVDGYIVSPQGDGLAMTRCLGDWEFKEAVTPVPFIRILHKPYDIIVLASDGLWDVMTPAQVNRMIRQKAPEVGPNIAEYINTHRNTTFKMHDNSSIIVVALNHIARLQQPDTVWAQPILCQLH